MLIEANRQYDALKNRHEVLQNNYDTLYSQYMTLEIASRVRIVDSVYAGNRTGDVWNSVQLAPTDFAYKVKHVCLFTHSPNAPWMKS